MNLEKQLPMTETTYYILLALLEPGHGYYVMQRAEELSAGRVRIAAGTMYGALDNLSRQGLIASVPSKDPRRKTYITTMEGKQLLKLERDRINQLIRVYDKEEDKINA
ncbi:MAG TPA: helix-turn-helix transcriptional regulator [Lachnospiraceae bacterium]|nr:helix-turn-helix transcriptional regulator [Lachnospiraceae bacterium]